MSNFFDFNPIDREAFRTIFDAVGIENSIGEQVMAKASAVSTEMIQLMFDNAEEFKDNVVEQNLFLSLTLILLDSFVKASMDSTLTSFYDTLMNHAAKSGKDIKEVIQIIQDLNDSLAGYPTY